MPVATSTRGSDLMLLSKCSNHLDFIAECIEDGEAWLAKDLLKETLDTLLVIGDRHGLQLRVGLEGVIE